MDPVQSTPPVYPQPQPEPTPMKKGGINPWMVISMVLLVALVGGAVFAYMKYQALTQKHNMMYVAPSPSAAMPAVTNTVVSPTATPEAMKAGNGTVTGTLCYPASLVPAGTIYAKDTTTNKETTQAYAGTSAGASTSFTMQLPVGTYHMKFVPTQYSTVVGYYTEYSTCVGDPSGPNCSGQATRNILPVVITSGGTVAKVNICDYYYPASKPPAY